MRPLRRLATAAGLTALLVSAAATPAMAEPINPAPRRSVAPRPGTPPPLPAADPDALNWYDLTRERVARTAPRPPAAATPGGPTRADFDGDGIDEIVTSATAHVFVDYSRLAAADRIHPVEFTNGTSDFGEALAAGDFDGDGFDDLAIGSGAEYVYRAVSRSRKGLRPLTVRSDFAGGVWVIPGGSDGLRLAAARHFTKESPGVPSLAATYDGFGRSLAAGDLNGDGRDDLAIGAYTETVGGAEGAGSVTVLLGGATGLTGTGAVRLDQSLAAVPGAPAASNGFGYSLAVGDVTGDRYADLLIGVPWENQCCWTIGREGTGRIVLAKGGPSGVSLTGITAVAAWDPALRDSARPEQIPQGFGSSVAIGDSTGDGYGEVVTGAPGTQVGNVHSGAVVVLIGRSSGLSTSGRQVITQASPGVPGTADEDGFGESIAIGDITGDGRRDLLIGVPGKDAGASEAGAAVLLPGATYGFTATGARSFDQRQFGDLAGPAANDEFGRRLTLLNLDGSGGLDALVSSIGDTSLGGRGAVTTMAGGNGTLTPVGSWNAMTYAETGFFSANFGFALLN